ncbi:MAG: TRAP transporter substrate-binding protein, partial [Rubrivivax sp.]|nr:TRAP transporter substrate-binding protein [Rubrivivax sp.]
MKLKTPLISTALALLLATPALAQTMKAADVHPTGYPTVVAVESMGKKLDAATQGRIKFQMFPG